MVEHFKKKISGIAIFIIFIVIAIIFLVIASVVLVNIQDTIKNDGPVQENAQITFNGICAGENKQLIVCREAVICN